jgi:hypothetical protein
MRSVCRSDYGRAFVQEVCLAIFEPCFSFQKDEAHGTTDDLALLDGGSDDIRGFYRMTLIRPGPASV